MYNPSYLSLSRHHIYYFRWPLPQEVRQAGRSPYIRLSLRTREPKEALRLANMLAYHADCLIEQIDVKRMDYAAAKAIIEDYFAERLEQHRKQLDREGP